MSKALKTLNKEVGSTQSELNKVEKLLKLDPTNTALLQQKQELLAQSVEGTKKKLDALKDAQEKANQAMSNGTEINQKEYRELQREIVTTQSKLDELKNKAEKALDGAGNKASTFGDVLKAEALVEGAKGIASSLRDAAEESKEYMKIMGSLEVSSQAAGYTAEETAQTYKTLYGVLADDQTAATTTANLQALGLSQQQLTEITNGTIGAWAKYGDSIPIDGLAEAINETVKTGTVTGTFADVLNWAGTSEDAFNEKLQAANSESERANIVLQELANQGLMDAGAAWQENNSALVENNQANAEYQESMARLSETVLPILTKLSEATTNIINFLLEHKEGVIAALAGIGAGITALKLADFIGKIGSVTSGVSTLSQTFPMLGNAISGLTNPVFLVASAVIAFVTLIATKGDEIQALLQKLDDFLQNIFSTDWTNIFGPVLGEPLNAFFANVKNIWDSIKRIFDGIIDFIRGVFTGDWKRALNGIKEIFSGVFNALVSIAKAPLNGIIGLLNGAVGALNKLIGGLNKIKIDLPGWLGGGSFGINIPKIPKIPYLAKGGILSQGSAVVGEAGPELLTMLGNRAMVQPLTQQTKNTNLGGVNIYVYGAPGQSIDDLAEIIMDKFQDVYQRKEQVW